MKINYNTGKLPMSFIALGYMLLIIGVWRLIENDWKGIPFLLLSIALIRLKSGIIIDTDTKKIKKYIGLLIFKKGKWEDISQTVNIQIMKTIEKQRMSVLTISRTASIETYKLILNLPSRTIELMKGDENKILNRSKKIASLLNATLINNSELL